MSGLWIVYLASVLFIAKAIMDSKKPVIKYIVCALCIIVAKVPLYYQLPTIDLVYAFFGAPSILCVLIALSFLVRTLAQDVNIAITHTPSKYYAMTSLSPTFFVLYAIFGALLLLGTLNIVPALDVYHYEPLYQNLCCLLAIAIMIYSDRIVGIFFAFSCVIFILRGGESKNLIDVLFCPYLWVASVFNVFAMIFCFVKTR